MNKTQDQRSATLQLLEAWGAPNGWKSDKTVIKEVTPNGNGAKVLLTRTLPVGHKPPQPVKGFDPSEDKRNFVYFVEWNISMEDYNEWLAAQEKQVNKQAYQMPTNKGGASFVADTYAGENYQVHDKSSIRFEVEDTVIGSVLFKVFYAQTGRFWQPAVVWTNRPDFEATAQTIEVSRLEHEVPHLHCFIYEQHELKARSIKNHRGTLKSEGGESLFDAVRKNVSQVVEAIARGDYKGLQQIWNAEEAI